MAGPGGIPTIKSFGPLADAPIRGEVLFGPINLQVPIRHVAPATFPVAAAVQKLLENNVWLIGKCDCCREHGKRELTVITFPNASVF